VVRILVATADGLHTFDGSGAPTSVAHDGRAVTALGRAREAVWAILDASEVWHAPDATWSRVAALEGFRATCVTGIGDEVYVGSSEAHLFRLADGKLELLGAFEAVEGRADWYTPWGGPPDTRSIANWDDDVYVNVHVGGIVRTEDAGATWSPTIDIDADVHHVTTAEGLVLAACAGGLVASADRGGSWSVRTDGLDHRYSRAVAVCGDTLLVTASRGPRGGDAAVYRGAVSGGAFERCRAGLPSAFDDNIDTYCLDALPEDGSFAAFGSSDGEVFASTDRGETWAQIASDLPPVRRVLVMP
jgi:hypothetical protein